MVIGSGGRADRKMTDCEAARENRLSVRSGEGHANSPLRDDYSSRKQPGYACGYVCVCVRNVREETSLPPLNAPESVSMVMNKHN